MMTILMIDVEAGKEDLFESLHKKLKELRENQTYKGIDVLYLARCFTHSDISLMIDLADPEILPEFITQEILKMEGAWDIQTIHLLNPHFFKLPPNMNYKTYGHFTITLDVRSDRTDEVFKEIRNLAASDEAAISFLAYSFHSYDNDIILSLLAPDIQSAGKFVDDKIRTVNGVIDTFLWQISKWKFVISEKDWFKYINYSRLADDVDLEHWDDAYNDLAASFICAC